MSIEEHKISEQEHAQIAAAIRDAENKTSGEIFAVVAASSDDYFYVIGFLSALIALASGVLLVLFAWWFGFPVSGAMALLFTALSLLVLMIFFALFPKARLSFIPRSVAYRRASSNAIRQFLAHGIHETSGRSGVLIFVSVAERYAEVVADAGINEKVEQEVWNALVGELVHHAGRDEMATGFIKAIERAGAVLAAHFPPNAESENELEDKLIEL